MAAQIQTLFMPARESMDFVSIARDAVKDVGGDPELVQVDTRHPVRLSIIRPPNESNPPDGDALNGFTRPSYPLGTVCRFRSYEEVRVQRLNKGCHLVLNATRQKEVRPLLRLKPRGITVHQTQRKAKPIKCPSQDNYEDFVPVLIPKQSKYLEEVADAVGGFNDDNDASSLAPYLLESLYPIAAAVSIQAAWRAHHCRIHLAPSLLNRVLEYRASVFLQRWWRNHLFQQRVLMLGRVRDLVHSVGSSRELCITKASYALLSRHHNNPPPRIFPENRLPYSFDPYSTAFIITPASVALPGQEEVPVRTGIPAWLEVDIPAVTEKELGQMLYGMTESVLAFDDVLPLIHKGVETSEAVNLSAALFGKEGGPRVKDEEKFHKIYRFSSSEEAKRRLALLLLLTWDVKLARGVELVVDASSQSMATNEQNIAQMLKQEEPHYTERESALGEGILRKLPPDSRINKYGYAARRKVDEKPLVETVAWQTGVKWDREDAEFLRRNRPPELYRNFTPRLSSSDSEDRKKELDLEEVTTVAPAPSSRDRVVTPETYAQQAQFHREEIARNLHKKAESEFLNMRNAKQARDLKNSLPVVVRSANTSSLPPSSSHDQTPSHEVRATAQRMRAADKAANKESVSAQKVESVVQLASAKKDMQQSRFRAAAQHADQRLQNLSKIELNNKIEEEICRRKVACRKWQRARQVAMKEEQNFVRLFECQHNALSKQMVGAEVRHLQGMDWQYTRREVDTRRRISAQRKQEVALELDIHQSQMREGAMDAAAKVAMLKEKQREAHEVERKFVKERVQLEKEMHDVYAPKLGNFGITPAKPKNAMKMVQIVSAT